MKIESKIFHKQNSESLLESEPKKKYNVKSAREKAKMPTLATLNFEEYVQNEDKEQRVKIPVYNQKILRLLDDLDCPLLLLPRIKSGNIIQKIGFFTDIRFTGIATIAMIVKIAKSFQAGLTLFNFAEPAIPEMDDDYAHSFFLNKGMSKVNGQELNLVNIEKSIALKNLESILDNHDIDLIAAMNGRKDLLYKLDFH
ncbi:hypothetical protein [Daejeonella sp.]|jgi:hypothetical protein|uniref:hypothetical protein n=1 Tax=Daejeonella sp. TaxID=2805397 RepID=UPI003784298C